MKPVDQDPHFFIYISNRYVTDEITPLDVLHDKSEVYLVLCLCLFIRLNTAGHLRNCIAPGGRGGGGGGFR